MRWSQLFERDVPLELLKDMEIQKDACDRIIQARARARRRALWLQLSVGDADRAKISTNGTRFRLCCQVKEELIREFQQELKNKDDEYVKALKKQARKPFRWRLQAFRPFDSMHE